MIGPPVTVVAYSRSGGPTSNAMVRVPGRVALAYEPPTPPISSLVVKTR
jgi:hypothetical protein